MSTNYYIRGRGHRDNMDPDYHVGKKTALAFYWVQMPDSYLDFKFPSKCPHCDAPFKDPQKVIESEDGDLYTWQEFMKIIGEKSDYTMLWKWFS